MEDSGHEKELGRKDVKSKGLRLGRLHRPEAEPSQETMERSPKTAEEVVLSGDDLTPRDLRMNVSSLTHPTFDTYLQPSNHATASFSCYCTSIVIRTYLV